MMNKEAAKSCLGWVGVNNTILVAHFIISNFRVSAIVVYAPVEPIDIEIIVSIEFYQQLQNQINRIPSRNTMFLYGDSNLKAGRNSGRWYATPGKEYGKSSRLLEFCICNNLVITNKVLGHEIPHKLRHSLDGKIANFIYYVILNRRLEGGIQDTRVDKSAVIDAKSKNHYLVVS